MGSALFGRGPICPNKHSVTCPQDRWTSRICESASARRAAPSTVPVGFYHTQVLSFEVSQKPWPDGRGTMDAGRMADKARSEPGRGPNGAVQTRLPSKEIPARGPHSRAITRSMRSGWKSGKTVRTAIFLTASGAMLSSRRRPRSHNASLRQITTC